MKKIKTKSKLKSTTNNEKVKLSKLAYFCFALTAVSIVLYVIAQSSVGFADFFNKYVSSIFRGALALITNIIPLSVAELFIICSPIILFVLIKYCIQKYANSWRDIKIFLLSVLAFVCLLFSVFVINFGIAYYTTTLDQRLELDKKDVSASELASTAEWLIEEINALVDEIEFKDKSSSVMPYTIKDMNDKLLISYDKISDKYDFINKLTSHIKPIMLSEPMTYTFISGVYTYFTGEANLNTNAPDYSLVYTTAHELAHQRGIAREDEANFIAFLVCMESDDTYIRYCGYMNLFEYVLGALNTANGELWETTYKKLDNRALYEIIACNDYYDKYRGNVVGEISGAINDAYLQANGTQGSVSYGLVVDLAVAYFHKNIEN